jgi:hypothetical protein
MILSNFSILRGVVILGLALAGCSAPAAVPPPQIVQQTVVVVVTATFPPDSPTPSPQTTAADTSTPAPDLATATPTPQANPSPTPLQLVNIPIEGGDASHMFFARLIYPDYGLAATQNLMFQVNAHSPMTASKDGANIESVDFSIDDPDGNQVYEHLEKTVPYCAFGDNGSVCDDFDFASNNYQWPNNGGQIVGGRYTIRVEIIDSTKFDMNGQAYFNIQVP